MTAITPPAQASAPKTATRRPHLGWRAAGATFTWFIPLSLWIAVGIAATDHSRPLVNIVPLLVIPLIVVGLAIATFLGHRWPYVVAIVLGVIAIVGSIIDPGMLILMFWMIGGWFIAFGAVGWAATKPRMNSGANA